MGQPQRRLAVVLDECSGDLVKVVEPGRFVAGEPPCVEGEIGQRTASSALVALPELVHGDEIRLVTGTALQEKTSTNDATSNVAVDAIASEVVTPV
jgi:hypothetical protein